MAEAVQAAPVPPPPAAAAMPLPKTEPLSYWDLVGKQFRKNGPAVISTYLIVLLFLVSTWAPLLCEGRPLIWHKDGETTYPLLRWVLAPTESVWSVEYLFNYFIMLTLALPLVWLVLKFVSPIEKIQKSRRWIQRCWMIVASLLLSFIPFLSPGSYERNAREDELAAHPDQKTVTVWHLRRRWKLDPPEYLAGREKLNPEKGDYAIFPPVAQDPLQQSSEILNPPGTYVLFEAKKYCVIDRGYFKYVDANIPYVSMETEIQSGGGTELKIPNQPEKVIFRLTDPKIKIEDGKRAWIYGSVERNATGGFDFNIEGVRPQVPPITVQHWLGTDEQGRDVLARLLHGGRISLSVGLVAVAISALLGIFIGGIAGYYRGWVDILVSRIIETVICFPTFFLIITIIAVMDERNIIIVMVVIGVTGWTGLSRLVRGEFLKLSEQDFVHSARALGCTNTRVMFRHILPNAMGPLLVSLAFSIAGAVEIESSLSYLGFGAPPPIPSWGEMVRQGMAHVMEGCWWLMFFPGFLIFLTLCVYNMAGEGLRDAMDPRLRK